MAIDPVCGMEVTPDQAIDHNEYKGKRYYFCSISCAEKFEADPQRYVGSQLKDQPRTNVGRE